MKWLHLAALGCMSALTGAHALPCLQDPAPSTARWIIACAYLMLTGIQAITVLIVLRRHKSSDSEPPCPII
jgi:hypothetical protein